MKKIAIIIAAAIALTFTSSIAFAYAGNAFQVTEDEEMVVINIVSEEDVDAEVPAEEISEICSDDSLRIASEINTMIFTATDNISVCLQDGEYLLTKISPECSLEEPCQIKIENGGAEIKLAEGTYGIAKIDTITEDIQFHDVNIEISLKNTISATGGQAEAWSNQPQGQLQVQSMIGMNFDHERLRKESEVRSRFWEYLFASEDDGIIYSPEPDEETKQLLLAQ